MVNGDSLVIGRHISGRSVGANCRCSSLSGRHGFPSTVSEITSSLLGVESAADGAALGVLLPSGRQHKLIQGRAINLSVSSANFDPWRGADSMAGLVWLSTSPAAVTPMASRPRSVITKVIGSPSFEMPHSTLLTSASISVIRPAVSMARRLSVIAPAFLLILVRVAERDPLHVCLRERAKLAGCRSEFSYWVLIAGFGESIPLH